MNTKQILTEVLEKGFSKFELSEETIDKIKNIDVDDFVDGFHVNNAKQIEFFSSCKDLSSILFASETYLEKMKYRLNSIHISRVVEGGSKEKYRTHFDSHIFTLVVPIVMPNEEIDLRGQLYLVPNLRQSPKNDLQNFITKLLALKYRGEKNFPRVQKLPGFKKVNLEVGQAILFNGSRSLHGNFENRSEGRRVTFIYHMTDPFPKGFGFWMREIREFVGLRSK